MHAVLIVQQALSYQLHHVIGELRILEVQPASLLGGEAEQAHIAVA